MALKAFPFLAEDFKQRHSSLARVIAGAEGKATVQPLTREGEIDDEQPPLADLALPYYCKQLGPGSIVRIGWDWWDAGEPAILGIETALLPVWRLESLAGYIEVGADGTIKAGSAGVELCLAPAGTASLINTAGASIVMGAEGTIAITSATATVIDGIPYPPP